MDNTKYCKSYTKKKLGTKKPKQTNRTKSPLALGGATPESLIRKQCNGFVLTVIYQLFQCT